DVEPKPSRPHWYEQYLQPCVAELLGTAIFVFVGCLSVIMEEEGIGILQAALVHGLATALLVAILGEV
ncbi:AQP8 protein, partial [Galbula dea]|nr:AQP8 protein [Galbula dea]